MLTAILAITLVAAPTNPQAEPTVERPKDEYLYLHSKFDVDAFSSAEAADGNFDGSNSTFPEEILPADKRLSLLSPRYGKLTFLRPRTGAGNKNMLTAAGQRIAIRTRNRFNLIVALGASHPPVGTAIQPNTKPKADYVTLEYTDGSKVRVPFGLSYWTAATPSFGDDALLETVFTNRPAVRSTVRRSTLSRFLRPGQSLRLWSKAIRTDAGKTLAAIHLPNLPETKIAALTLASRELPALEVSKRPPADPAMVAIFAEPGFPYYQAPFSLRPKTLQAKFESLGISSSLLDSAHLSDAKIFNRDRFHVLVMPQGSAYPQEILENLKTFREAGGCLVANGRPFTRPLVRNVFGHWVHSPEIKPLVPTNTGNPEFGIIGTVGISKTHMWSDEKLAEMGFENLPWDRLTLSDNFGVSNSYVGIETRQGQETDRIIPWIRLGSWTSPIVVAVERDSGPHSQCADVFGPTLPIWLDNSRVASELHAAIAVRGAAWCLKKSAKLDDATWEKVRQKFDGTLLREAAATVEPANTPLHALHSPPALAKTLHKADVSSLTSAEKLLLATAQGLINRRADRTLFLIDGAAQAALAEVFVNESDAENVATIQTSEVLDLLGHRRAVVVDPDVYGSVNLATMVAASEGLLVAYPGLIDAYKLEVVADLRGTFGSHHELTSFAIEHLLESLSPSAVVIVPPTADTWAVRDYLVAHSLFAISMPDRENGRANAALSQSFGNLMSLLRKTAPATPFLRYTATTSGLNLQPAWRPNQLVTRHGKVSMQLPGALGNLSSQLRFPRRSKVRAKPKSPKLNRDKIYLLVLPNWIPNEVAMNTSVAVSAGRQAQIRSPFLRSTAPRGQGVELAPSILVDLEIASFGALAQRVLIGDDAARSLMLNNHHDPKSFGLALGAQRQPAIDALFDSLGRSLAQGGFQYLSIPSNVSPEDMDWGGAVGKLPDDTALIYYAEVAQADPLTLTRLVGKVPVFRSLSAQGIKSLIENDGLKIYRPFFPLFITTGESSLRQLERANTLDDRFVVVRPSEGIPLAAQSLAGRTVTRKMLIASGDEWRYRDDGENLGKTWLKQDYDDSKWRKGKSELGYGDEGDNRPETTKIRYGDDPESKHPCYYFRKTLNIDDKKGWRLVVLETMVDDGCVVYLNGKEIGRDNMAEGEVTHESSAQVAYGGAAEVIWRRHIIPVSSFRKGDNVIAVEVHQASASSSDLSFDLKVTALGIKSNDAAPGK